MNCASARSSLAANPFSSAKRAPESFAAVSKFIRSSSSPSSQCGFGSKEKVGFLPHFLISMLSVSSIPTGTSSLQRLGMAMTIRCNSSWIVLSLVSRFLMRLLVSFISTISGSAFFLSGSEPRLRTAISLEVTFLLFFKPSTSVRVESLCWSIREKSSKRVVSMPRRDVFSFTRSMFSRKNRSSSIIFF